MASNRFLEKVKRTIESEAMIRAGERVLVALSGGPDSVALTHALLDLGYDRLVLAHLNHALRPCADADEAFCEDLAGRLSLPLIGERVQVAALARQERCSLEEAGRLARYRFFEKAAREVRCSRIALGHTRNDQAETLLLRLLRGSGTTGLCAIHPVVQGTFIRPLLGVERRDILGYLAHKAVGFREDSTNADRSFPRNRLRHETLPHLEVSFNPSIVDTLARTAELMRDEESWMNQAAEHALARVLTDSESRPSETALCRKELEKLHPALARRVVRKAIQRTRGHLRGVTARHVEDVLELLRRGKSGRRLTLPGLDVGRDFDRLWVRAKSAAASAPPSDFRTEDPARRGYNGYELVLPVPGRVGIPEGGGFIRVEEVQEAELCGAAGSSVVVGLPRERAGLTVRNPRRGDRFRPLGAPGTKSLARYLMERRVEREGRLKVPLVVVCEPEEILWVAGHGVSESSRVGPGRRLLRLSWCRA